MNVYMLKAALYCEPCGEREADGFPLGLRPDCECGQPAKSHGVNGDELLECVEYWPEETLYDSDDYPKGPYPNGGGEADTPQHCDSCSVFLENPLTEDGRDYVRGALAMDEEPLANFITRQWAAFYEIATR
jgi:hypothetical protein